MTSEAKAQFFAPYLRGVGQIMLQNSALTGLMFVLGIAINSLLLTAGLVVGVAVGTLTARVLKYDAEAIDNGLYGFNAALVGISMLVFFEATVMVWIVLVLLSVCSTILMNQFVRRNTPAFTFPFVFMLWIALFVFRHWLPVDPPAEDDLAGLIEYSATVDLQHFGFGFGEVIFQASMLSGIVFFLAVYLHNPTAALYGLAGTFAAVAMAAMFMDKTEEIQQGWFTFNAVLAAIALSGPERSAGAFVLIAVFISVLIESIMQNYGLTHLTFPFIAAAWITLAIRAGYMKGFQEA